MRRFYKSTVAGVTGGGREGDENAGDGAREKENPGGRGGGRAEEDGGRKEKWEDKRKRCLKQTGDYFLFIFYNAPVITYKKGLIFPGSEKKNSRELRPSWE